MKPQLMYYRKTGTGPVLVLLHGFPDSGAIWEHVAAALSTTFTVIVPDLPGSGKSPLAGEMLLSQMAAGIMDILDAEGIDRAVIAGHSMGGYTAMAFAALFPLRLSGLSLIHSTPAADDEEKKKTRLKVIELILKGGKETFIRQMTLNMFAPGFVQANAAIVEQKVADGTMMSDKGIINFYKAMIAREDTSAVAANAPFPMQWILGRHDSIIDFKKILNECHRSTINFVSLYNSSGHMSILEQPAELIADLQAFGRYCFSCNPSTV
jgi:pimeloyl-ACP methyl ester carboxylesterase